MEWVVLKAACKWRLFASLMFPLLKFADYGMAAGACNETTLHGVYVYSYTGFTGSGSSKTDFAVAGYATFNGDGTLQGVSGPLRSVTKLARRLCRRM